MNLHDDEEAFAELLEATAEAIGLPEVYVEKDYWVTRALQNLAQSSFAQDIVFKGGTSLSKVYRLIDRFSEDIDLAVLAVGKTEAQRKKLLKSVETVTAQGLAVLSDDLRQSKGSRFRKTVYQYPRAIAGTHFGQASPQLLIEINAFTYPEPYEQQSLQSFIAQMLADRGQTDLIARFELHAFAINVLSVERTLVEKMLGAIKASYLADPAAGLADRIRHLYDICLILREEKYRKFVRGPDFKNLCAVCVEDEKIGFIEQAHCFAKPLSEAPLFVNFANWRRSLDAVYKSSFADLVYGELPDMQEIADTLLFLHQHLNQHDQSQ